MMDTQTIINVGGGAILSVLGWFARSLWDAIQSLQRDIHQIEVDLPQNYVRKEDYAESMREVRDLCRQIFDKISNLEQRKADRGSDSH
jgi:hypothetical protein